MKQFFTILLATCCLTAFGQSEYCLEGTVWDDELGGCVPEVVPCGVVSDLDGDGSVGAGDLLELLAEFGYTFPDADADGVCDEIDDCVGEFDECGVCNGPGPTVPVIESIEILYDSVYAPQIDQWLVFEIGADTTFSYTCEPGDPVFQACGDPLSYQGYDYATVLIGEQCWFAENLRSENYENGDAIPSNLSDSEWSSTTSGATTVYGEGASNLETYGRLYNWYAVDDARALCPSGWHVPTDGEWTVMTDFLGGVSVAGGQMKTEYGWFGGGNGTNASGFSGLPGGYRVTNGNFTNAGNGGNWWSSSPYGSLAWLRYLYYYNEHVYRNDSNRQAGYSVRCIKDTE